MFSVQEEKTMTWQILKPGYAPPEQYATRTKIGPWTDIYALGATLYRALTGKVPVESTNRIQETVKKKQRKKKWEDPLIRPRKLEPAISKEMERTILMAMAIQPELRFPNINKLIAALQYRKKIDEVDTFLAKRKWRRVGIVAGIVLIVGGLAIAALGTFRNRQSEARVLQSAQIEAWIPCRDGENEEELKKTYEAMSAEYLDTYSEAGVSVKFTCIAEAAYEEELKKAFQDGNGPELYESTGISEELMDNADLLQNLLGWSEMDECVPLKNGAYETWYPSMKKIPLGLELPVLCVNMKLIGDGNLPDEINDISTLEAGKQGLSVMSEIDQLNNFLNTYYTGANITENGNWDSAKEATS